jgi:hypothetical protein
VRLPVYNNGHGEATVPSYAYQILTSAGSLDQGRMPCSGPASDKVVLRRIDFRGCPTFAWNRPRRS